MAYATTGVFSVIRRGIGFNDEAQLASLPRGLTLPLAAVPPPSDFLPNTPTTAPGNLVVNATRVFQGPQQRTSEGQGLAVVAMQVLNSLRILNREATVAVTAANTIRRGERARDDANIPLVEAQQARRSAGRQRLGLYATEYVNRHRLALRGLTVASVETALEGQGGSVAGLGAYLAEMGVDVSTVLWLVLMIGRDTCALLST